MSRDQIKVGSATTLAPSQRQQALYDHRQSLRSSIQVPVPGQPKTLRRLTLNPSSAISIDDSPSDTNSPRFSANSPPSNDIFSMDFLNSLSPSS
ncbi:hypothetical protein PGTUg99_003240 [Puccinia graminis f. sp. tritici]|uniref:Uncharacterized protein n=1 Tax=Puccinia graminis f. sp. tritici TaxID=56615 RepID=A0A5B0RUU9_PUCGR|nr:hypothetical protein PGTUg99_003240 [Puccinia graminis f. sp. tritici]